MLLQTDDNKNNPIEEDIMGEFVDLEDPNEKNNVKKGNQFGVGANFDNKKKKPNRSKVVETYEEITV